MVGPLARTPPPVRCHRTAGVATRGLPVATVALVAVAGFVAVACSEKSDTREVAATASSTSEPASECTASSVLECAAEGTTLDHLMPDTPIVATGDPVRIGMINTDTGAAATFPEIALGAQIGVDWLNTELGGIGGHPIELVECDAQFSATGSQSCGQQMVNDGVPVVLGGIDVFGDGILVLESNGIPYVGGVPVSFAAVESPLSFQFSGGSWGMNLGFVHHITEVLHAESVSIVYGDFGSVTDGAEWARKALIRQGIAPENVNMVSMPIVVEDMLTPLSAANESDPDAIIVLVADSGCGAAYEAALDIRPTAQLYWSAACMESGMIEAIGSENVEGYIYAVESPVDADAPDTLLYADAIDKYGDNRVEAQNAAAVGFASMMNLYSQLVAIGADSISAEAVIDDLRSTVDQPSFMGHPYTCDGMQMGGALPAICAPQQILVELRDGIPVPITDWIEVADLVQFAKRNAFLQRYQSQPVATIPGCRA